MAGRVQVYSDIASPLPCMMDEIALVLFSIICICVTQWPPGCINKGDPAGSPRSHPASDSSLSDAQCVLKPELQGMWFTCTCQEDISQHGPNRPRPRPSKIAPRTLGWETGCSKWVPPALFRIPVLPCWKHLWSGIYPFLSSSYTF